MRWTLWTLCSLACLSTTAKADDYPARKAGLWEISMTVAGSPRQTKFCIDAATDAAMYQAGMENSGIACSRRDIVRSGPTVTIDAVCTMGQRTITTHMTTVFAGDTAYRTENKSRIEPPIVAGRPDSTTTQDAKWVGPCPADMLPGDMLMPNGVKMNVIAAQKGGK